MSDIFTSKIDDSSSGPIPAKDDSRPQNILLGIEQREIQGDLSNIKRETQQELRDFTALAPDPPSLDQPRIQQAPTTFGATPIVPQFTYDVIAEMGRQSALDIIKNITINGQAASINGSNISFDVQQQPKANEIFTTLNTPIVPSQSFVFQPPIAPTQDTGQQVTIANPASEANLSPSVDSEQQELSKNANTALDKALEIEIKNNLPTSKSETKETRIYDFDLNQQIENIKDEIEKDSVTSDATTSSQIEEAISEKKSDREKNQSTQDADSTYYHGSNIPVLFQRADGQRKIIALLDDKYGGIVEGPNPTAFLPPPDSYYIATGETIAHPWKIELRTNPNTQNYEIRVSSESRLFSGIENWSTVGISNLGSWVSLSYGYVVLSCGVSGSNPTSGSVNFGSSFGNRISISGTNQTGFRFLLGNVISENSSPKIKQYAFHNLTIFQTCVDGKPAIYPIAT
jgi:hypothetical protein